MSDTMKAASERLETAVNTVAQAAQALTMIESRMNGAVVSHGDWSDLQESLREWRAATQDFLTLASKGA